MRKSILTTVFATLLVACSSEGQETKHMRLIEKLDVYGTYLNLVSYNDHCYLVDGNGGILEVPCVGSNLTIKNNIWMPTMTPPSPVTSGEFTLKDLKEAPPVPVDELMFPPSIMYRLDTLEAPAPKCESERTVITWYPRHNRNFKCENGKISVYIDGKWVPWPESVEKPRKES